MWTVAKRIASKFPASWQQQLKRSHYARQIARGDWRSPEPEHDWVGAILEEGDWAIDIGANIGHYAVRFASLVGVSGRVIAFEPVPDTFALLAQNVIASGHFNISLFNLAASENWQEVGMSVPTSELGLRDNYLARIQEDEGEFRALAMSIDSFSFPKRIRLVKIDAEGHELQVLRGMTRLLELHHPVLIVEDTSSEVQRFLESFGYAFQKLSGSSNLIFQFAAN
jgi:FkbM family methyltransferase